MHPSTSPSNSHGHGITDGSAEEESRRQFPCHSSSLSAEDLDYQTRESSDNEMEYETDLSDPSSSTNPRTGHQWRAPRGIFRILKKGPQFPTFHNNINTIKKLSKKKSRSARQSMPSFDTSLDAECLPHLKSSWKNFSLSDLADATNNFSEENIIGEGGYSEVFRGNLKNGQLVAIKRLNRGSTEEVIADYLSELGILVHVNHPNIANVIGYGVDGGMHLVLHLSAHGSLSSILTGDKENLTWKIRYKIALGTAEGLSYLHEGCQRRIIHRDIKAANILLSEDFDAQISDFGMSKWLPDQWTHLTVSQFEGTFGYLPPEFFMHGIVDEKTDVYSYGVLLLEVITGRLALDKSQKSLVMWAKPLLTENKLTELIDPCLGEAYDTEQLSQMVTVAAMCLDQIPSERPTMSKVVQMLQGEEEHNLDKLRKFTRVRVLKRNLSLGTLEYENNNNPANI
ncbi:receptor-like cytosolic serine/threonine-protein kinase RBK2 [Impatiens glandulifera]|uniref:receptor-like cytosolic serine/threonine-protein kinase RBK2 n=1 Tax=Impatiens glandulifera TaxID=253017 RepID=UPI001FB088A8|nr:receptor-like cytosolic serine/threonine-protein kinase RBK2 [Impatiens glandulifera]